MPDERDRPSATARGVMLPEELSHWLRVQTSGVPARLCLLIAEEIRDGGGVRTRPLRQFWICEQLQLTDNSVRAAMRTLERIGALFSREERDGFIFWFGDRLIRPKPAGPPRPETAKPPTPGAASPSHSSDLDLREALADRDFAQPAREDRSHLL